MKNRCQSLPQTIQKLSKIGKVLSKIAFIIFVIGVCGCIVGLLSLRFGNGRLIKLGGVTLHGLIDKLYFSIYNSYYI